MLDRSSFPGCSQQKSQIRPQIKKASLLLLAALALCLMDRSAFAQVGLTHAHPNLARGSGSDKTMERYSWDSVNLFNGNLNISIPVGIKYPLAGEFGYQFTLNYNSNVWDLDQPGNTITANPLKWSNAGFGWDLSFGRLAPPVVNGTQVGQWVYISPDGTLHPFFSTLHYDVVEIDPLDDYSYTRDGTYYRMAVISATQRLVEAADGVQSSFQLINGEWKLAQIADRFNNRISFNYSTPNAWVITDNHARSHTVYFKADSAACYPAIIDRIVVAAFNGTTAVYTLNHTTATVTRPGTDNDPGTSAAVALSLLTSITHPDGSRHNFTYASQDQNSSGRLSSMQLPTLGKIAWSYTTYSFVSSGALTTLPVMYRANTGVGTRSMFETTGFEIGKWTYAPALKPGAAASTNEHVWVQDSLPQGATPWADADAWTWVSSNPLPRSGSLAHQSSIAPGMHQHYFYGATNTLPVNAGDVLIAYVHLDPANVPSTIMLQWNDGSWEHRAYWGANQLPWGMDGTGSRRFMGPLPAAGQWVRLEVPAAQVGLEGRTLNGMAFSLSGGRATWDYAGKVASTVQEDRELSNTVTTPLGDKTINYFSVNTTATGPEWNKADYALPIAKDQPDPIIGRFLSTQIFDCDAAGNNCRLLQSVYTRYEQDGTTDPAYAVVANVNRREASQRVVYHDDIENGVPRFAGVDRNEFDGLGHFRRQLTNGNFGSGDIRENTTEHDISTGTYPSASFVMPAPTQPWLINLFSKQRRVEGANTRVTEFCFDRNTGFLNRQRRWQTTDSSGTVSPRDVLIVYTPDAAGQVVSEQYYGGDVQPIGTGSLCSLAIPAADQYRIQHTYQYGARGSSQFHSGSGTPVGPKYLDSTIDRNTGLPSISRDISGIATAHEYDAMGRGTWDKPESGHGAWTKYDHLIATGHTWNGRREHTTSYNNAGSTVLSAKMDVFDGFGRLWAEQKLMPGQVWATRHQLANAMGSLTHATEYSLDAPQYTLHSDHDPFGRPRLVSPPDGAHHKTTYQYAGFRSVMMTVSLASSYRRTTGQVNETPRSMIKIFDRQGRLCKEISRATDRFGIPRDVVTSYSHNLNDQLVETKRDGVLLGPSRSYDGRGFLQTEYNTRPHPETMTFLDIDARGNARRSQRLNHLQGAVIFVASAYDRAGRLVRMSDPNNPSKVWKDFVYAETNDINDWRAGKLWKAVRFNDMSTFLPQVGVAAVTETYTYGAIGGRVSKYEIECTDQVGRREKFDLTHTYTDLGDIKEIGYPNDVAGSSYIDIGRDRKVNLTYSNGQLTSVGGSHNGQTERWADSISYFPNGLVSQVVHANGVTDNATKDPNGMVRVAAFATSGAKYPPMGGSYDIAISGYQYDGAGNLVKAGDQYFVFEEGYQPPAPPAIPPYGGPCESGWTDPLGLVYASADYQCNARVFYFYTADDRVFKIEDAIREEKLWYFYDDAGRLLTEHVMVHTHYLPWANTWQYTRDYIYNGQFHLAMHDARRAEPSRKLHYHYAYGATSIVTDQNGFRIPE